MNHRLAMPMSGNWQDDEFLTVEPGGKITFEDSLEAGESQGLAGFAV
jgi:hypothetical protein